MSKGPQDKRLQPLQITLGTSKLSLEPLRTGPWIEFTDYETDITWLSGPIFLMSTIAGDTTCSYIAIQEAYWSQTQDTIDLTGQVGHVEVSVQFRMADYPVHLEVRITLANTTDNPVAFDLLRIGPIWSPPKSWWQYWDYWRLLKITSDIDPEKDLPRQPGEKLSSIADRLQKRDKAEGSYQIRVDAGNEAVGWIVSDDRRFLLMLNEASEGDTNCRLDVFESKPPPTFIMGGIGSCEPGSEILPRLDPGSSWTSPASIFIPGKGGWLEALVTYRNYTRLADE